MTTQKERRFSGELLRKARRQAGLTQKQLAEKIDKSRNLIGLGETNDSMSTQTAHACASALGISPDALFEDVILGGAELSPQERQVVETMRIAPELAERITAYAMGAAGSYRLALSGERRRGRGE